MSIADRGIGRRRTTSLWAFGLALGLFGVGLVPATGHAQGAQETEDALKAYADDLILKRFEGTGGDAVEWPAESPRPELPEWFEAANGGTRVHFDPRGDDSLTANEATALASTFAVALERMAALGWGTPPPDGGRGGSSAIDIYVHSPEDALASARGSSDGPSLISYFDGAVVYAQVSAAAARDPGCVAVAAAEALLLARDAAESAPLRSGVAAWLAERAMGIRCGLGHMPAPLAASDVDPWHPATAAPWWASADLWARLAARTSDDFVRDVWDFARQRTPARVSLRGEPDIFRALAKALAARGLNAGDVVETLAADQALLSAGGGAHHRSEPLGSVEWADLPEHSRISAPLAPYESATMRVETRAATAGEKLRVWCDGEYGVDWSLVAVRLDEAGREVGRLSAPRRTAKRRRYFLVELDAKTAEVVLVATNLGSTTPDPDLPSTEMRAVKFIVDRSTATGGDGGATDGEAARTPPE